jgi:hypothetical protein
MKFGELLILNPPKEKDFNTATNYFAPDIVARRIGTLSRAGFWMKRTLAI